MTTEDDRKLAESVLNRLMKNSAVTGMRFFTPQLLLDGPKDINQEAYINLTSEWVVFDERPGQFPASLDAMSQQEEELTIHSLRGEEVKNIEILSPWPHLVVNFKSGKILYMNGKDEQLEPWTAGLTSFGESGQRWLVVACPGGGLAVWAPDKTEGQQKA